MDVKELNDIVEHSDVIKKEVTDIFLEMDTTDSMATQVSLNNLLLTLYDRLEEERIMIEAIGSPDTTQEQFEGWVENNLDDYSTRLFAEAIGKTSDFVKPENKFDLKEALKNLFDNDPTNSNNIFDRIQDQMTSPSVDEKVKSTIEALKNL